MRYLFDTSLFALMESTDQHEFEDFLFYLQDLEKWQMSNPDKVFILSSLVSTLSDELLYPFENIIDGLIKKYRIDYIQGHDVNRIMSRIIEKTRMLDELPNMPVIECLDYSFVEHNSLDSLFLCSALEESFVNAVVYSSQYCESIRKPNDFFVFFVKSKGSNYRVKIRFQKVDNDSLEEKEQEFDPRCYSSLSAYLRDSRIPEDFWQFADNSRDLERGVRIKLLQELGFSSLEDVDGYSFIVQESFYDCFKKNHYHDFPHVIRAGIRNIVEIIRGQNLSDTHSIRVDKGGNSKDLEKNGFKALRRTISEDGKRIHYWKNENRFIFANIGEHKDIEISNMKVDSSFVS